ncbi:hypothetical protein BBU64B_D0004 (plasmid) [Borreliella burgdorferi 64b]|nr:hypothetical protein BBU64B_D0004 [Borreliella burgdorferi 64b]
MKIAYFCYSYLIFLLKIFPNSAPVIFIIYQIKIYVFTFIFLNCLICKEIFFTIK